MKATASDVFSAYSFISSLTIDELLNVGFHSKDENPIPSFDENFLIDLCSNAQQIFASEENVLNLEGNFIIVGDIHGSLHDLLRILKLIHENDFKVLFLGDYVDRGSFSLECITLLFALKILHPDIFYLIRGNHEFDSLCRQYGFKSEILNSINTFQNNEEKGGFRCSQSLNVIFDTDHYIYTERLYEACLKVFAYLPICAIINQTTFCVHGGLSPKLDHIDRIYEIQRPIYSFDENALISDMVWSDPTYCSSVCFQDNPRGLGSLFNGEAILNFLNNNSFRRIIRGHQCVQNGSSASFGDKCITVFSASSYNDLQNNYSAVLKIYQNSNQIKVCNFPPIQRLQKSEAVYYKFQKDISKKKTPVCFSLFNSSYPFNVNQRKSPNKYLKRYDSQSISGFLRKNSSLPTINQNLINSPSRSAQFIKKPAINDCNMLSIFAENKRFSYSKIRINKNYM